MDNSSNNLQAVIEEFQLLLQFLERPVVQYQIIAFIAGMSLAWVLTNGLWSYIYHKYLVDHNKPDDSSDEAANSAPDEWPRYLLFIRYCTFPLLAFLTIALIIAGFNNVNWLATLLVDLWGLVWFLLAFRVVVGSLFALIGKDYASFYYHRLLAPTFWLFVIGLTVNDLIDVSTIGRLELPSPFGQTVTIESMFFSLIVLYFLIYLSRAAKDVLTRIIIPQVQPSHQIVVNVALTLGRYAVLVLGVLTAASAIGIDLSTIALISGGLSVGIGLGLQKIAANFISGLVLLFEQSVRSGDVVVVDGTFGTVNQLNARAVTIRTFDNVELLVPNEEFLIKPVTNYTRTDPVVRVVLWFTVSFDTRPSTVIDTLIAIAKAHPDILTDPEPTALCTGYGDYGLKYRVHIWLSNMDTYLTVPSEIYNEVWEVFNVRGLQVPYPQQDIHIRSNVMLDHVEAQPSIDGTADHNLPARRKS